MKWTKKYMEEGHIVSYYYECVIKNLLRGDVILELNPPYERDPWMIRLYIGKETYLKKSFRLRGKNSDDVPESMEDIEKAQEKAFEIVIKHMQSNAAFYKHIAEMLESAKDLIADTHTSYNMSENIIIKPADNNQTDSRHYRV